MRFPAVIVRRAWRRQGGRCATCGKRLNPRKGWHAHHRKPDYLGGTETLRNCVILCINPPNCHYYVGHGGIGWDYYNPLNESEVPYLYWGRRLMKRR